MLADGRSNPMSFTRCCGSKTYPCAKTTAEQTQMELMERAAVPTGVQSSRQSGVSLPQQVPARDGCALSWVQVTRFTSWDRAGVEAGEGDGIASGSVDARECGRKAVSRPGKAPRACPCAAVRLRVCEGSVALLCERGAAAPGLRLATGCQEPRTQ